MKRCDDCGKQIASGHVLHEYDQVLYFCVECTSAMFTDKDLQEMHDNDEQHFEKFGKEKEK